MLESIGEKNVNGEKIKGKIHSLSLRIPNLAGDVAVHKVEGFLDKSLGNSTGVNVFDLAVIHQADFDVDAIFNHHDMPLEVINSVTRNLGKTPDAFVYKSDSMDGLDIFNMGAEVNTVGKGGDRDSLEEHYNNFRNSQKIFGSIMNLSSGLGALNRLEFSYKDGEMMDMGSDSFIPNKQRMKNVLQSVIDATKKSNSMSKASSEEVVKFILFGRTFDGSEVIVQELAKYRELKDHKDGDSRWDGMFDLSKYRDKGRTKEIIEDSIIESMNIVNSQARMLTGVTDAAGRRPPDMNQIIYIRNRVERFLKNPNKTVFNNLLFKYRVLDKNRKSELVPELIDLFYGREQEGSYADNKLFLKDLFKKGSADQSLDMRRNPILSLRMEPSNAPDGKKNLHLTGVGGIIADRFGTKLHDKSKFVKVAKANDTKFIHDFIDKIEAANMLASEESLIDIKEFSKTVDAVGGAELFGKYGDVFFNQLSEANPNNSIVEKYSLMYHVLDKRESSLRQYVRSNQGSKFESNSVARAQYKLNVIGSAKEFFHKKEADLIDSIRKPAAEGETPSALKNFFHFQDYDLRKRPTGYMHKNTTAETQYIYRVSESGGRVKYSFSGSVEPISLGTPGKRFLIKGAEYVVLKNPVRYELMTNKEHQDSFALLRVVGEALPHNIEGIGDIDGFYDSLGKLKGDFYELNSETFKVVKDSQAFAQRNWMDAKVHEDQLISEFFRKSLENTAESHDDIFNLAAIVIKPRATTGLLKLSGTDGPIALPSFKMNRRLVLAVERYLHSRSNEAGMKDVYDSIFGQYGRFYRKAMNNIALPSETAMYTSDMYMNGELNPSRDPLLDFIYDKPGFLYMPNVLQRVQQPLRRYGGTTLKGMDMHGNIRKVINYEGVGSLETLNEYYSSKKNYEDVINTKEVCY